MKKTVIFTILCLCFGNVVIAQNLGYPDITNKELIKSCSEKTEVWGRDSDGKLVPAGETIDGFCSGYLQATFNVLINSPSCKKGEYNPEFIFSVYRQYIKDKKVSDNVSATSTLMQAIRRVLECK
jgi:hypothetical protein